MGEQTKISWTDHTWNPWWGCLKVSPGCINCYAEQYAHRYKHDVWGPAKTTPRRALSEDNWSKLKTWNKKAKERGVIAKVFCASMADVFEDHPMVAPWRYRFLQMIPDLEWLDLLLLTKRPENMTRFAPADWAKQWPDNVIAMTSTENQEQANKRIPHLALVPVKRRGLSCEPLLGPIDLTRIDYGSAIPSYRIDVLREWYYDGDTLIEQAPPEQAVKIHWVIAGGESGSKARPMNPAWARSLRDQCAAADTEFHFKQWGGWKPFADLDGYYSKMKIQDGMVRVGTKKAGRVLDGITHDGYPAR